MSVLLRATDLHKSFGRTPALVGANLEVQSGEFVAIMGPSGSGKSTLLQCAAGIIQADQGSIAFRDRDLMTMSDRDRSAIRRLEFGFIFQYGHLVPELTCLENVALPLRLRGTGRAFAESTARHWLNELEVRDIANQRPTTVSGGQAQRVAIARALTGSPSIIFADEPTGSLDSLQTETVMNILTARTRESHSAVVLVTHDPQIAAYSDREVIVRDGRTSARRIVT